MIKSRIFLWLWSVLAWFPVPEEAIRNNTAWNRKMLSESLWREGEFIETQQPFAALRFGKAYTMEYGGCGLIAVHNAMLEVGKPLSADGFLQMTEQLQRKGAAWFGKYGIHPAAIRRYLREQSFSTLHVVGANRKELERLERVADVWIATVFNGRRLKEQLHTVCITRTAEGRYVPHNAYRPGEFASLTEAISHISAHGATALYTIGVCFSTQ